MIQYQADDPVRRASQRPDGGTLSVNYTYDVLGNLVLRNNSSTLSGSTAITEYYGYDGLNRLCTVSTVNSNMTAALPTQPCQAQTQSISCRSSMPSSFIAAP